MSILSAWMRVCRRGNRKRLKGLFKSTPRTPAEIVRETHDLLVYIDMKSNARESKREEKIAELSKLIRELKSLLYGNSEAEPVPEACAQLTQEFFRENTLRLLIICLPKLKLEAQKDATQVVSNLQRQSVHSRLIASDYLEANKDILDILLSGYNDLEIALHYGAMLRECIRHQSIARSSAALFSGNSYVLMRSSLYGLPNAAWKRDIRYACIGVTRLDWFLLGFGIRCFSSQESHTSAISKENLKPPMDDESDAFYVVRKGDIIGVYKSLSDCQAQVSTSVCDPSVSVYKGYSLHKESEDYLASRGFKDSLYSMHAAYLKEDIFGTLVPCPFQQPDGLAFLNDKASKKVASKRRLKELGTAGSGDASPPLSNKLCKSIPAVEAQPISCKPMTCILEFDGASKGNPGKAGAAAVLRNGDGSVVSCIREGLGIATNNVAEYRALLLGMKYALMKGFKHIQVQGDSQLICMQVQDLWQTKNQNMAALCKEVKKLKEMFQSFNIIHVKRGFNAVADNLAYSAITLPVGEVCEDCGPFN